MAVPRCGAMRVPRDEGPQGWEFPRDEGGFSHPNPAHQADADGAIPIRWGEDIALGPGHPLVQAPCEPWGLGVSPWEFRGAIPGIGGIRGAGTHPCRWGSNPQLEWEAGGSREQSSSRRHRGLVPPARTRRGSSQVGMVPWEGMGGRDAHLAGAALASRLRPASARLPRDPPVPTMRGWWDGGAGGSHGTWERLRGQGWGGGRELGTGSCHREVGRGGAPREQVGAGREQDKGGWMLQGLQDGRWGQDRFGVP